MSTFTANIGLIEPGVADPAVSNVWGGLLNENATLLDSAIAGLLVKDVSGSGNIVLTSINGAPDEARYAMFNFTGTLTGNIAILWPAGVTGRFTVKNSTSGAFTLSLGANNGSSAPAGATVTVPQGKSGIFQSDGTNVTSSVSLTAGTDFPSISGGFTLNFTVTNNTNVTLPPSGQIASLSVSGGAPSGSGNPGQIHAMV